MDGPRTKTTRPKFGGKSSGGKKKRKNVKVVRKKATVCGGKTSSPRKTKKGVRWRRAGTSRSVVAKTSLQDEKRERHSVRGFCLAVMVGSEFFAFGLLRARPARGAGAGWLYSVDR